MEKIKNIYKQGELLSKVNNPEDLRKLKTCELPQLAKELRQYIIDIVSERGGHFGASLGVVELTIALHYIFDTPNDQLVWDVGHQAYGHKILTGRKEQFPSKEDCFFYSLTDGDTYNFEGCWISGSTTIRTK